MVKMNRQRELVKKVNFEIENGQEYLRNYYNVENKDFAAKLKSGKSVKIRRRADKVVGDIDIFHEVLVQDCYMLQKLAEHVHPQKILDIGANVGYFSLAAFRLWPNTLISCIEPETCNYNVLIENLDQFKKQTTFICAALSSASDNRMLYVSVNNSGGHSLINTNTANCNINVKCISLEELIVNSGHSCFDLVKLDIEGAEYEVLLSTPPGVMRMVGNFIIELHPTTVGQEIALRNHLQNNGFTIRSEYINRTSSIGHYKIVHYTMIK